MVRFDFRISLAAPGPPIKLIPGAIQREKRPRHSPRWRFAAQLHEKQGLSNRFQVHDGL